jgi:serine/threonine-protein kinase
MIAQQQVGKYTLQRMLGTGAAGSAYEAVDTESGDRVAVKLLNAKTASNPDIQNRFVREVSVLEKLHHPHIVQHIDCGIDEQGRLYFVMELVDSGTLRDALRPNRRLPWQDAAKVAAQVCEALAHAHQRGVIHRDLKPANLFLSSSGSVKVGDFGLARDMNLHRLTATGNTVGTCRYMAPEQVRGEDELTGAVDLYALGCIMFEMLAGRSPFDGDSVIEIFEHHLFTPAPRVDALVPKCPRALADYIEMMMAKKPELRPVSAEQAAQTLAAIARGETVDVAADCPHTGESADAEDSSLIGRIVSPAGQPRQVNRAALVIALALALIAIIVVASR